MDGRRSLGEDKKFHFARVVTASLARGLCVTMGDIKKNNETCTEPPGLRAHNRGAMVFQSMMTVEEFKALPSPEKLSGPLKALWYDARGDWGRAHDLAQQVSGRAGDRVHAYLHRKEGDEGNARYWYHHLGMVKPAFSVEEEWLALVREFLNA